MSRIFIAVFIAANSSSTVGKKRNITERGMVICCGMCIRCMAAMNSLTVVDESIYDPIISDGIRRTNIMKHIPRILSAMPVRSGISRSSAAFKTE